MCTVPISCKQLKNTLMLLRFNIHLWQKQVSLIANKNKQFSCIQRDALVRIYLWIEESSEKKNMKSTIFPSPAGVDLSPALQDRGKHKFQNQSNQQLQNWILNVNGFGDQTFSRSSIILIRQSRDTGRAQRCSKFGIHQMPVPALIKGACWWMRGGAQLPPAHFKTVVTVWSSHFFASYK